MAGDVHGYFGNWGRRLVMLWPTGQMWRKLESPLLQQHVNIQHGLMILAQLLWTLCTGLEADIIYRALVVYFVVAENTSAHQHMRDTEREPFYDDKTPSTGCGSECVSRCTSVYTTWHLVLDTCRHSANLCPAFMVAVTYAQLVVVNWTSPVSICRRTGDRRLPTPVLHPGTRCPTISRTLIFPFSLSNVILRHSSFPHELAHLGAFEISYKNALYKFTVIIIVIIIISHT